MTDREIVEVTRLLYIKRLSQAEQAESIAIDRFLTSNKRFDRETFIRKRTEKKLLNQLYTELSKSILNMKLSYDEWYSENEEEVYIQLAETGADREMGFDSEREFQKRYQKYLET